MFGRTPAASVSNERDPRVVRLRQRLDRFYASTCNYTAFQEDAEKPEYWAPVRDAILETLRNKPSCKVLEFGAGRSNFGRYLGDVRGQVLWHAQDVTRANESLLRERADVVHLGDLSQISEEFDVVFSTFVWEHITNPAETLGYLLRMLSPGGRLIVASPRYDFPFYIPPSARHYTSYEQVMLTLWLTWKRLQAIWCEDARFLIHLDPAVLRSPWYRDADAVHWVSRWDIRRALPPGYGARWLQPQCRANIRQRLFFEFMLLFVEVSRTPTGASKLQESEPWQSDPRSTPRSSSVIPYA